MTVGELISELNKLPQEAEVFVCNDGVPVLWESNTVHVSEDKVGVRGEKYYNVVPEDPEWSSGSFERVINAILINVTDTLHGGGKYHDR